MFLKRIFYAVLNFLRFIKFRETDFLTYETLPQMNPGTWDLYCDKQVYEIGDNIIIFLRNLIPTNYLVIEKLVAPYQYERVYEQEVLSAIYQPVTAYASSKGCDWTKTYAIPGQVFTEVGYYRIFLTEGHGHYFTFILSDYNQTAEIAILAPCTTWVAYNPWGGKSFYNNGLDKTNVYYLSTLRPNSAPEYNQTDNIHDINVEANIFLWFQQHYKTTIYPDYILEQNPTQLLEHKIVVLAYHAEYFSETMYKSLRKLIYQKGKSLINLGGNQIYWKVKWHNNFTRLECRKNCAPFENTYDFGGLWRNSMYPEKKLLGVKFTDEGTGSYAPYRVVDPAHWLYAGSSVKRGDLFGLSGINELAICGDETDKETSDAYCIARGTNPVDIVDVSINYPQKEFNWDGRGGGVISLKPHSDSNATLSTGSIQSGSGLGVDIIFTGIVKNFIERYIG